MGLRPLSENHVALITFVGRSPILNNVDEGKTYLKITTLAILCAGWPVTGSITSNTIR